MEVIDIKGTEVLPSAPSWKMGGQDEAANERSAAHARGKFEAQIRIGVEQADRVISDVVQNVPRDLFPVTSENLSFGLSQDTGALVATVGGEEFGIHDHAFGQFASRGTIPAEFARRLALSEEEWQRELIAHSLREMYANTDKKFFGRIVDGEFRGFMSDSFAPYDSVPLIEAFTGAMQTVGAVPIQGVASDTRWALKAALPEIYEPVKNEILAYGVELRNSDYGHGALALSFFAMRCFCVNLLTTETALRKVHLGAKLDSSVKYSRETYRLNSETQASAINDVMTNLLSEGRVEEMNETIRVSAEKDLSWEDARKRVSSRLSKAEVEKVGDFYESADTYNLPEGKTAWRLSNAVSWLAVNTENKNRKLDLERIAGKVINA